jgi:nitrous oxide reductase
MEKAQNTPVQTKRKLTIAERGVLATGAMLGASTAFAAGESVDVSAGVTVIAGAVAAIALVGAAKIVPNATMQVWGYVKQAFNRT